MVQTTCSNSVTQISQSNPFVKLAEHGEAKNVDRITFDRLRELMGYVEAEPPCDWQLEKGKMKPQKNLDITHRADDGDNPIESLVCLSKVLKQPHKHSNLQQELVEARKLVSSDDSKWFVVIEICTEKTSGFSCVHRQKFHGIRAFVIQITRDEDILQTHRGIHNFVVSLKESSDVQIVSWISPPCTGGSPAQHLSPVGKDERIAKLFSVFRRILKTTTDIVSCSDIRILELSRYCAFWKSQAVMAYIREFELNYTSYYDRCAFQERNGDLAERHTYRIQSNITISPSLVCDCDQHKPFDQVNITKQGAYPRRMVENITQQIAKHIRGPKAVQFEHQT